MTRDWRAVWRGAICPQLSDAHLEALRLGLGADDPRLLRRETVLPPHCFPDNGREPCTAGCPLAYPFAAVSRWAATVDEVYDAFSRLCHAAGRTADDRMAAGAFLDFVDGTAWPEVRVELLIEVQREQERRRGAGVDDARG